MRQAIKVFWGGALSLLLLLGGCAQGTAVADPDTERLTLVATTTMLADLSGVIGGKHVSVNALMGPGIDPHLYKASAGDVSLMQKSDVVVYNGLHLEGKMGEVFESLSGQGHWVICIEEGLDPASLLTSEDGTGAHDPHIWFNVALWKVAAAAVANGLSQADPEHAADYTANLKAYLKELDEVDAYIRSRVAEVPEAQRVLVTAHDAFNYFGNTYGFEVRGLQGISTDAEAGTADVSTLADFIAERQIPAVFVESSVPPKTIEALQAAVRAKGFEVAIGGELYSDSLGGKDSGAESYILTFKANIDTIVEALK